MSRAMTPLACLLLAGCLVLAGCAEDRPGMPESHEVWLEAELPALTVGSSLSAIAFSGHDGYAIGWAAGKAGTDYLLLARGAGGAWTRAFLIDTPDNAVFLDLAAGASGLALGGYLQQDLDPCLVYDERGVAPAAIARAGQGIAAIDGGDDLMVAGGVAIGGALWASRVPGQWSAQTTPFDQLHEGGFTDVFVGGGRALACGFDDGADTLQVVLRLDEAGVNWERIPLGAGIFGKTLQCVAAGVDGTIYLGGLANAGGAETRAFLWRRNPTGAWSTVTLPDGEFIGGVNDILPDADGSWRIACGGEGGSGLATIIRVDGQGAARELTPFAGSLMQLAASADGSLHAAGYRLTPGAALHQPIVLVKAAAR